MVVRLFAPPSEGQHGLVPKRPDELGASATLQYSVLLSTALAATYTSFTSSYQRRVTPRYQTPKTTLFIRSSAKLGLWGSAIGAAVTWSYYSAISSVVASQRNEEVEPWKLYKWTKQYTVDDACLAGAGLGLLASVPALFMRRPGFPRWTRCLGMANVGASAGILGAHGYLQYSGKRQAAYKRLERQLQRQSAEFWAILQDQQLMAHFSPFTQLYIRHNVFWYAQHLPDADYDGAGEPGSRAAGSGESDLHAQTDTVDAEQEEEPYYFQPLDYADDILNISVEATLAQMEEHEAEILALSKEAEYVLYVSARKQHEYCHRMSHMDEDERMWRLQELQLLEITFNKLRNASEQLSSRLIKWRVLLQHKAAWDNSNTSLSAWMPNTAYDFTSHDPEISIQEMQRSQATLSTEIKNFEEDVAHPGYSQQTRNRWRQDLEYGRTLLRTADRIMFELEKVQDKTRAKTAAAKTDEARRTSLPREESIGVGEEIFKPSARERGGEEASQDKNRLDREKIVKSNNGNL